SHRAQILPYTS
ncbi:unnamed protein product, partial [Rotaria magnacalcarata]